MTVGDPTTLKCNEVVELVTEFLSESLHPQDRARLEQHLLVCPPCTIYVGQIRTTAALAGGLRARPVDPDGALVDLFRRWRRK